VKIVDERDKFGEPKPGTSKDDDSSVVSEKSNENFNRRVVLFCKKCFAEYTLPQKIVLGLLFVWAFIQSSMVSMTNFLNKYSRDYRYVIRVLAKEKKFLKVAFSVYRDVSV
jgi:hypothetical protein